MSRKVAGVTAVLNGGRWGQANDHALGTRGAKAGAATDDWGGRSRAAAEATGGAETRSGRRPLPRCGRGKSCVSRLSQASR